MTVFSIPSRKMYGFHRNWVANIVKNIRRLALQKRITPKQISRMPLTTYDGEIVVVRDASSAETSVDVLLQENILGFDIESRPAFSKGESYAPSLMQLAGRNRVYIFMLSKIGGLSPLKPVLEDDRIAKVGAAVDHDIQNLFKIEKFDARGFNDLGTLSKQLKIVHTGLRNLAAIFLRLRISKKSQLTDWSQEILTPHQITYAATDAWVSREIFVKMTKYLP
ncbi:MAG: 3'-5' exonuclease domain-containing protein 2 [Puniceicoccales bacterium]|jgi:ribonuclease D|nr:3'-5' exonuclease domain-containing protein 2 [Puniceicoccales bacterium]